MPKDRPKLSKSQERLLDEIVAITDARHDEMRLTPREREARWAKVREIADRVEARRRAH